MCMDTGGLGFRFVLSAAILAESGEVKKAQWYWVRVPQWWDDGRDADGAFRATDAQDTGLYRNQSKLWEEDRDNPIPLYPSFF